MTEPAGTEIKGIIFDLGSTLIRFDGEWPAVFALADDTLLAELARTGLALDGPAFISRYREFLQTFYAQRESEFVEYTAAYLLREALKEFEVEALPDEVLDRVLAARYAVSEAHWHPMPTVHETLSGLRDAGYKLGLVSNASDTANVQRLIDRSELRAYFDPILVSAALGIRKPNPRIFQIVLEQWGLAPTQVVVVGDTLGADILGAQNAGIRGIWLTVQADGPANRAHEGTIVPDAVAASLNELPALIRSFDSNHVSSTRPEA